jgi:hypothetical protein
MKVCSVQAGSKLTLRWGAASTQAGLTYYSIEGLCIKHGSALFQDTAPQTLGISIDLHDQGNTGTQTSNPHELPQHDMSHTQKQTATAMPV